MIPLDVGLLLAGPFFVNFDEACADEAHQAVFVREDPDFDGASVHHPVGWADTSQMQCALAG